MLATPADTEEEIFANFPGPFYVEDKYDGIRAQLHVEGGRAALYSRTLDDVSHQFPEIVGRPAIERPMIADGEIVAFKDGQVLPFRLLQKRLGRKKPPVSLMNEIPVALMIFDVLYLDGRTLIDEPLIWPGSKMIARHLNGRPLQARAVHASARSVYSWSHFSSRPRCGRTKA